MTEDPEARRARIRRLRRIELAVLIPLLAVAYCLFRALGTVQVVGVSMMPTLHPGQKLLLLKWYRTFAPIHENDIVVIVGKSRNVEGEEVIKRVVFLQNERGDRPWPEFIETPIGKFRATELFPPGNANCPVNVPNGIYLLGDNMMHSEDSRDYGSVQLPDVFGKVISRP